ncbi:hypothetical protein MUK42_14126 [Musa troglodytarum]|uniref:Uncharacterized protein n=1 Tax=Musa troglodytarum TaxID=320322 RepID=A0A9E7GWQ7_9LILI|nr:hypothetical protein MUK42_14126 [Musa troglodytarum]
MEAWGGDEGVGVGEGTYAECACGVGRTVSERSGKKGIQLRGLLRQGHSRDRSMCARCPTPSSRQEWGTDLNDLLQAC